MLLWWIGLQLLSGLPQLSTMRPDVSSGVAVWAHIGGFLAGAALIKLFVNPALMSGRLTARVGTALLLLRHQALRLSVHRHGEAVLFVRGAGRSGRPGRREAPRPAAGHEGLEPPTAGFGDRCSTN